MSRPAYPNDFSVWFNTRPALSGRQQLVPLQPQGDIAMQDITKRVGVKWVGSTRGTEIALLTPGTTTRDLMRTLGLDPTGYQVLDARNEQEFKPDEILFARVADGDLVHISAHVQAGT